MVLRWARGSTPPKYRREVGTLDLRFEEPPHGSRELAALLERSGVDYRREGERFRFLFANRGRTWRTVCDGRPGLVLIYGIHPALVGERLPALELCDQLNRAVVQGGFFLQEERFVFRTGARLQEHWQAQEAVAQALEYNAAVLSHFWAQLAAAGRCEQSDGTGLPCV